MARELRAHAAPTELGAFTDTQGYRHVAPLELQDCRGTLAPLSQRSTLKARPRSQGELRYGSSQFDEIDAANMPVSARIESES